MAVHARNVAIFSTRPRTPRFVLALVPRVSACEVVYDSHACMACTRKRWGWQSASRAESKRRLPCAAWEPHADFAGEATERGYWPDAFLHIDEPFLPKGCGATPQEHRGLFMSPVPHRVAIGAEWTGQTRGWMSA